MPGPRLTAAELAARINRPVGWVCAQAKNGNVPALRIGGKWRFDADEIDAWERRQHNAYRDPMSMTPLSEKRQAS